MVCENTLNLSKICGIDKFAILDRKYFTISHVPNRSIQGVTDLSFGHIIGFLLYKPSKIQQFINMSLF